MHGMFIFSQVTAPLRDYATSPLRSFYHTHLAKCRNEFENLLFKRENLFFTMMRLPGNTLSRTLRGKQVSRLYSNKSPAPQPNPPKQPTTTTTPKANNSGGFPVFSLTLLTIAGGFTYLAYEIENENPMAIHIAGQLGVQPILEPFHTAIDFVDKYYSLKPAKTLSPPSTPVHEEKHDFVEVPTAVEVEEETHEPPSIPVAEEIHEAEVIYVRPETENASEEVVHVEVEESVVHHEEPVHQETAHVEHETSHHADHHQHHHHEVATEVVPILPAAPATTTSVPVHSPTQSATVNDVISAVAKNSLALRQELEQSLLKDLHTLDASALRLRVSQLTAELFERMSWENIRLTQSVHQVEQELHEKYSKLLKKQKEELEYELERVLFEREKAISSQSAAHIVEVEGKYKEELYSTIKAQADGFQATLQRELHNQQTKITNELQEQLNHAMAMTNKQHSDVLMQLQPRLETLSASLTAYHSVIEATARQQQLAQEHEAFSTAVNTLEFLLNLPVNVQVRYRSQPQKIQQLIHHIQSLSAKDALVNSVLNTLPQKLLTSGETVGLADVQVRFHVMRQEVRKVALAPKEVPSIVGQLIGSILATISLTPKGYVTGAGTEEALARAAYHIERGNVPLGLKELESIQGYEQTLMKDWRQLADEYLLVQQGLRILKTEALVRHEVGSGIAK